MIIGARVSVRVRIVVRLLFRVKVRFLQHLPLPQFDCPGSDGPRFNRELTWSDAQSISHRPTQPVWSPLIT